MKMRRKQGIALSILCTALLGLPRIAPAQAIDTSWLDWKLLDAGGVDIRTGKAERGTVTVDVAILIHAKREKIWEILKACEIAPDYVPNVVDCVLIDSINDGQSELFIQTVKPAFFIPAFEHVFRLDYYPPSRIEVHRVSGPIAEMDGAWLLQQHDANTVLLMHTLKLQPGIPVPRMFVRATLRRDLPVVLTAVRDRAEAGQPIARAPH